MKISYISSFLLAPFLLVLFSGNAWGQNPVIRLNVITDYTIIHPANTLEFEVVSNGFELKAPTVISAFFDPLELEVNFFQLNSLYSPEVSIQVLEYSSGEIKFLFVPQKPLYCPPGRIGSGMMIILEDISLFQEMDSRQPFLKI